MKLTVDKIAAKLGHVCMNQIFILTNSYFMLIVSESFYYHFDRK